MFSFGEQFLFPPSCWKSRFSYKKKNETKGNLFLIPFPCYKLKNNEYFFIFSVLNKLSQRRFLTTHISLGAGKWINALLKELNKFIKDDSKWIRIFPPYKFRNDKIILKQLYLLYGNQWYSSYSLFRILAIISSGKVICQ